MSQASIPAETLDALTKLIEQRSGLSFAGARRSELLVKLQQHFAPRPVQRGMTGSGSSKARPAGRPSSSSCSD